MRFIHEVFPTIVFFVVYQFTDLFTATFAYLSSTGYQAYMDWKIRRKISKLVLINLSVLSVVAFSSFLFNDENFIKWQPTIVNWLISLIFASYVLVYEQTLVERLFGAHFQLKAQDWLIMNRLWSAFFFTIGALNLLVAKHFDSNTWVNFKVFGMMALLAGFFLLQRVYLLRNSRLRH